MAGSFRVAETRTHLRLEFDADILEPVDRLAALVGIQAGDIHIERAVPFGIRREPLEHFVGRKLDARILLKARAPSTQDAIAQRRIAADLFGLFEHHDARAVFSRLDGGGVTACSRADHHDVDLFVPGQLFIGAALRGASAQHGRCSGARRHREARAEKSPAAQSLRILHSDYPPS